MNTAFLLPAPAPGVIDQRVRSVFLFVMPPRLSTLFGTRTRNGRVFERSDLQSKRNSHLVEVRIRAKPSASATSSASAACTQRPASVAHRSRATRHAPVHAWHSACRVRRDRDLHYCLEL